MIHTIACNQKDCPWRRNKAFGCAHPDGMGKVITRKSLDSAVPDKCPLRKHPDILVAAQPAGGLLAPLTRIDSTIASINRDVSEWAEMARAVHTKRSA